MKARVKTAKEKADILSRQEVSRIFKLCCVCLNQAFGFGEKRMKDFCIAVSQLSAKIHETPEQWYYMDEYLIDKYNMGDIFEREDIDEREATTKLIHKEHGRKWREY